MSQTSFKYMLYVRKVSKRSMPSVILLFVISVIFSVCSCLCQNGWTRYNDSCYLIGYEHNVTFIDAEHFCRQHNGHLIHVNSAEENRFIIDTLYKTKASYCWIGISDMDVEGTWEWYGTGGKPEFTSWSPGEPGGSQLQDCGVFAVHHQYNWDDYPCDIHFHPICETRCISQVPQFVFR